MLILTWQMGVAGCQCHGLSPVGMRELFGCYRSGVTSQPDQHSRRGHLSPFRLSQPSYLIPHLKRSAGFDIPGQNPLLFPRTVDSHSPLLRFQTYTRVRKVLVTSDVSRSLG